MASRVIARPPSQTAYQPPQALRHEHHYDDEQQAEDEARRILDAAQKFGNNHVEHSANDRAADRAETADNNHAEERNGEPDIEAFRIDVADEISEQPSREGCVERTDGKGTDLVSGRRNPQRSCRNLAFLDDEKGTPGTSAADFPRPPEARRHDRQSQIVKAGRPSSYPAMLGALKARPP